MRKAAKKKKKNTNASVFSFHLSSTMKACAHRNFNASLLFVFATFSMNLPDPSGSLHFKDVSYVSLFARCPFSVIKEEKTAAGVALEAARTTAADAGNSRQFFAPSCWRESPG